MSLDKQRVRMLLGQGDFQSIFIEELGWDRYSSPLEIAVASVPVRLQALAQKRGMVVYHCPTPSGETLPDSPQRRKIEKQVAKSVHEHMIVFTDAENETQIWQLAKREVGKPVACPEHDFHRSQSGELLLQKLEAIAFSLEEEETLSLTDVTRRTRSGFDVEGVTKSFYDRFQKEHKEFLMFVSGITDRGDQEWYASLMLNRLMFIYFIQRKGFLDGDRDYLRNRLNRMREEHGDDKFYSFYHYFLLRLFHEGLGSKERSADLAKLVGRIPFLNGGLFDIHEIEKSDRYGTSIQIADQAFERIFDYFDQYQWHLDERPLRADNEINPDVLGYIFEKYINQKQMGAYYTKEDITGNISKNTILPFVLDAARYKCKVAFENPNAPTVWDLLREDPDRYIYPAVSHGGGLPIPDDIAIGLNPSTLNEHISSGPVQTLKLREGWNKAATPELALPTETWREVIVRRKRYQEIKAKLAAGEVSDINDLITLNLDIRQFVQDVIENCEGPELLRSVWNAVESITVLDPTCGSGAFLFAALNILESLYETCLNRMEAFVEDADRSGEQNRREKFTDLRRILERVASHPNPRYFIFKSIILNNLYGVDIMEEAVEVCKLRLFLKLASQVEPDNTHPNLGIEPLPDIDFNIRVGNTLVGYATYEAAKKAIKSKLDFENAMEKISIKAADLQQLFDAFRKRQVEGDGSVPIEDKHELRRSLYKLDDELNHYLANEYKVDPSKKHAYAGWLKSHQPFHWFVEFYRIISGGGFDVIIGNPPYVEYSKIKKSYTIIDYETESCGNLYAYVVERCYDILRVNGYMGMIVQLPIVCTDRMKPLQRKCLVESDQVWFSNFDDRPAKLFDGLEDIRATIFTSQKGLSRDCCVYSTMYNRWYKQVREELFDSLSFSEIANYLMDGAVPKISHATAKTVIERITHFNPLGKYLTTNKICKPVFFHNAPRYWIRAMDFVPYFWNEQGGEQISSHVKTLTLAKKSDVGVTIAVLNSSLFYWWFLILSNCRDLSLREIKSFPLGLDWMSEAIKSELSNLTDSLMVDFKQHKKRKKVRNKKTGEVIYDEYYPKYSKPIIDKIDIVLAEHYGFTEEELDFIINYDIKYRVGSSA